MFDLQLAPRDIEACKRQESAARYKRKGKLARASFVRHDGHRRDQ